MDIDSIRKQFDHDERLHSYQPQSRREASAEIVRYVNLHAPFSFILYSSLIAANADAIIEREIEYFNRIEHGFEWKTYSHDALPDLPERLAKHGFEVGEQEAVMVLDLAALPDALAAPVTHDVRPIINPDDIAPLLSSVQSVVFGDDDEERMIKELARELRDRPQEIAFYAAYSDGIAASAAWIRYPPGSAFASLWGGATLEAYRGRGLYTALVAARAQEAKARGYRYLFIDASAMSRPIVARHGFVEMSVSVPCTWETKPGNL
ncbi:MAG: GNAT family N-acetyltransferase [Chloroflexota bacterium]|nr:GNAT family N-acetyltransferase [Chloroflexota bacterium]